MSPVMLVPSWPEPLEYSPRLTVRVVSTLEGLRALRPEWDGLYDVAGNDNPFSQWLWVWHWWQAYGRSGRFRRYRLHICEMRSAGGELRALVPLVLTTWGRYPLALRALRLYGFRDPMSELRAPLVWPGCEAPAAAALVEMLREQSDLYDWCALEGLEAGGPLSDWFHAHAEGALWEQPVPDYVLPLPPTWEALRAGLKRNVKENIRHSYNSLQREGHLWEFECVTAPEALPETLHEFFRLHAARSIMPDAPSHPNHYASSESRRFLSEAAPSLAAAGRLRVCRLRVGARVVAAQLVLVTDDSFYLSFSGFDPAWRRYGVMTLLTTECIKQAIMEGRRSVNLSAWPGPNKRRWRPQEVVFEGVRLFAPTRRARLAARLHSIGLRVRDLRWRLRPLSGPATLPRPR